MTYTNAQKLLLRFCKEHGYTDIRITGSDRLFAADSDGHGHKLGINLYGDILDLDTRQVIAAADTSHDIANTYELPGRWKRIKDRNDR